MPLHPHRHSQRHRQNKHFMTLHPHRHHHNPGLGGLICAIRGLAIFDSQGSH